MSTFEWVLYDTSKRSFQTSSRDTFCNIMRVDTTIQRSAVTSHVWSVATPINCEVIHSLSVVDKLNVWLVFTIYGWHVSILYKQFCIGIPNYLVVVYGCIGFFLQLAHISRVDSRTMEIIVWYITRGVFLISQPAICFL